MTNKVLRECRSTFQLKFSSFRKQVLLIAILLPFSQCAPLTPATADENPSKSAAELLPDSTVIYGEIRDLSSVVDLLLQHPIRKQLEAIPAYGVVMNSPQMTGFRAGVGVFQSSMGMRWQKALLSLTSGGVHFAFDLETEGAMLLVQAEDAEVLEKLKATVYSFARGGNLPGSEGDPIKEVEYRGITAARIQKDTAAAVFGNWLLLTNKPEFGKAVLDRYLGDDVECLQDKSNFQLAIAKQRKQQAAPDSELVPAAWAYVDIEAIRDSGEAEQFYSGKTENILAEVLFGGIVSNLQKTSHVTFSARLRDDNIHLSFETPHQRDWIPEDRKYFFGPEGLGAARPIPEQDAQVLSLSVYRNVSEMWLRASDLMIASAVDGLDQADSQLSLFFSGKGFAEEVLSAFEPELKLVLVRPDLSEIVDRPAIKLPAFALEAEMKTPETTQKEMRRIYLNLVGFLNIIGAMEGQPQLDFEFAEDDNAKYLTANYVPQLEVPIAGVADSIESTLDSGPINYNFSPTVAFAGKRLIISSTSALAKQLASSSESTIESSQTIAETQSGEAEDETTSKVVNTLLSVEANTISQLLHDNYEQLITQNMLEKGHGREEAESEIDLLLRLLDFLKHLKAELSTTDERLSLDLSLDLQY